MTISSKLATDFVKRHVNIFKFPDGTDMKHLSYWDVAKATVLYNGVEFRPFSVDTGSTSCMMVTLPTLLKPYSSTLEEMLNKLKNSEIDMRTACYGYTAQYRVTTNRLIVLEKLFEKSGILAKREEAGLDKIAIVNETIDNIQADLKRQFDDVMQKLDLLRNSINK